ncbi:MAG: molecular chaperone DjlA [Thalassobius sp.]|nr:molecular chaperone DjlA [Thalassovita sp.]
MDEAAGRDPRKDGSGVNLRKSLWLLATRRLARTRDALTGALLPGGGADSVAFSISFIALSAKLAKADGQVTRDEVATFRRIFEIPAREEANVARVYNLCRRDVAGYEAHAHRLSRALGAGRDADARRHDVLDGLLHVAMADGVFHPAEENFIDRVAEIFEIERDALLEMKARHVPGLADPHRVLGVDPGCDAGDIRRAWRRLVRDNHPDRLVSRGLPAEMVRLATDRMAKINAAYEDLMAGFDAAEPGDVAGPAP